MSLRPLLLLLLGLPTAQAMAGNRRVRIEIPGLSAQPQRAQRQRLARGVEARPLVPAPAAAAAGLGGVALAAAILGSGMSGQGRRWLVGLGEPRRALPAAAALPDGTLDDPAVTHAAAALLQALRAGGGGGAAAAAPPRVREAALALAILDFCEGRASAPPAAALAELRALADTVGGERQLLDTGGGVGRWDTDCPGRAPDTGGGPARLGAGGTSIARAVRMATTASARRHAGRPLPDSPAGAAKEAAAGALLLLCEGALLRGVGGLAEAAAVRTRFGLPFDPSSTSRLRRAAAAAVTTAELRRFLPRPGSPTHATPLSPPTLAAARAALAPLPSLLGLPSSQLRGPLLHQAADYLYDCLEAALRAWAEACGEAGEDGYPSVAARPDPFVLADPFVVAEAVADVALACAGLGARALTQGETGEIEGDTGEMAGDVGGMARVQMAGDPGEMAGGPWEIAPARRAGTRAAGAQPLPSVDAEPPPQSAAGQLYLWHALSRQLFPVRITSVARHDFYREYLLHYARRAAAHARGGRGEGTALGGEETAGGGEGRGKGGSGGAWPIPAGGGDALSPAQLARPAALAVLLGTLPSAVRRDCAAAVALARREAEAAGAEDPHVTALERALGFAR